MTMYSDKCSWRSRVFWKLSSDAIALLSLLTIMPTLAIQAPSASRRRSGPEALADWLGWLTLAVLLTVLALMSGLGPSGSRKAWRLNSTSLARSVLLAAVVVGAYLFLRA